MIFMTNISFWFALLSLIQHDPFLSARPVLLRSSSRSRGHTLAMTSTTAQIPLRIAVAGAGVGGVLLGYALEKKGFNVTVFEKTAKFSRFGGPIQLASNALSCINSISPDLFDEIMTRFTFTGTRKCGIKDGIRNEWYSVFDSISNLAEYKCLPYTGVIDRPDLQDILLRNMKPGTVQNSMEIKTYNQHPSKWTNIILN